MNAHSLTLAIGDHAIRSLDGLYSLNDLHKASGDEERHTPNRFLRLDQTQALADEISKTPDVAFKVIRGRYAGTYACRELVIAYAAWISAAFHLKVIRVFLEAAAPAQPELPNVTDHERIKQAQSLGTEVAAVVSRAVFEAVLFGNGDLQHDRFLFGFGWDSKTESFTRPYAKAIEFDEMLVSIKDLPKRVADPGVMIHNEELAALMLAASQRLAGSYLKRWQGRSERVGNVV